MSNLVINGDLFSNQWALVVGIGLAFFLLQLVLSTSFCFRLRRQERAIKRLCRDFKNGGDGRNGVRALGRKHAWLQWVVANFPSVSAQSSSKFTREDALQELDTRIASNGNYLLLQRMGVMAPLLGVVLTVAGFYWLHVGDENESLQSILLAVTPLVSGVGTGAVLALINQALLHIAGRRVESLRMTARTWFDTVIWGHCRFDSQNTGMQALQAMDRLVKDTLADIDRLGDTLARAAQISVAISALPGQVRTVLDRKLPVNHNAASTGPGGRFVTRLPRAAAVPKQVSNMQG